MENRQNRSGLAAGILMIALGVLFLLYQLMPAMFAWLPVEAAWPLIVIGVGGFLLILGLLLGAPGMAVPACVVGGIGCLLYWQNATGNWESWSYAWALIPGFVGIGIILAGLLGGGNLGKSISEGVGLLITSLVMFVIFGSFLGGLTLLGSWWPLLVIGAGVLLLGRAILTKR